MSQKALEGDPLETQSMGVNEDADDRVANSRRLRSSGGKMTIDKIYRAERSSVSVKTPEI